MMFGSSGAKALVQGTCKVVSPVMCTSTVGAPGSRARPKRRSERLAVVVIDGSPVKVGVS